MLSAFGEPPDSGEKKSADAPEANASRVSAASARLASRRERREWRERRPKTRRILFTARRIATQGGAGSSATEGSLALLEERADALHKVVGLGHLLLDAGLEGELVADPLVEPAVELALRPGVGLRRAAGQALEQRAGLGLEVGVGDDLVDEAPGHGLLGADALAEERHLRRAGEADAARDQQRGAAVGHQDDVH